jgi:hypothetical protein
MALSLKRIVSRGLAAVLATGAIATGCGNAFVPQSRITSLRVLGVQIDTPYGKPGKKVGLEMLYYDGSPRAYDIDGKKRAVQVLWIGGCHNPGADLYYGCYPILAEKLRALDPSSVGPGMMPPKELLEIVGLGNRFAMTIPEDIISSRPPPQQGNIPYGLSYAFFAVCGGELGPASDPKAGFPLGCYDKETKAPLGPDDFVIGYTPIYSYETLENHNPVITGSTFQGTASMATPCEPCACDFPPCICRQNCAETEVCGPSSRLCIPKVPHCTERKVMDCTTYQFKPTIDPSTAESDETAVAFDDTGNVPQETVWVAYYANQGYMERDISLVNDAQKGWNASHEVKWSPPAGPAGESRIWAIVHDNRGGTSWWMQDVFVE